jgi:hypothetical protein
MGVIVGLLWTDGPWTSKLLVALLWPLGPLAAVVTIGGLLLVAGLAFPWFGALLAGLLAGLFWLR